MTHLLHAALGALTGWLIWRLSPRFLRGKPRPKSGSKP